MDNETLGYLIQMQSVTGINEWLTNKAGQVFIFSHSNALEMANILGVRPDQIIGCVRYRKHVDGNIPEKNTIK